MNDRKTTINTPCVEEPSEPLIEISVEERLDQISATLTGEHEVLWGS
jgi:hypothetical protein